jgi:hypothetical protein
VVVVAGAGWGGLVLYSRHVYGTVFTDSQLTVTVDAGDRFSLAVPDRGASVGDAWSTEVISADVLIAQGRRTRSKSLLDRIGPPRLGGGQGTAYFLYDARAAGTATVTLSNCFQGCDHPTTKAESRDVTWTITVR